MNLSIMVFILFPFPAAHLQSILLIYNNLILGSVEVWFLSQLHFRPWIITRPGLKVLSTEDLGKPFKWKKREKSSQVPKRRKGGMIRTMILSCHEIMTNLEGGRGEDRVVTPYLIFSRYEISPVLILFSGGKDLSWRSDMFSLGKLLKIRFVIISSGGRWVSLPTLCHFWICHN